MYFSFDMYYKEVINQKQIELDDKYLDSHTLLIVIFALIIALMALYAMVKIAFLSLIFNT